VGEGPGGKGRKRDVICLALFLLIRDWSVKMEWNLHEAGRVDTGICTGGGYANRIFMQFAAFHPPHSPAFPASSHFPHFSESGIISAFSSIFVQF